VDKESEMFHCPKWLKSDFFPYNRYRFDKFDITKSGNVRRARIFYIFRKLTGKSAPVLKQIYKSLILSK